MIRFGSVGHKWASDGWRGVCRGKEFATVIVRIYIGNGRLYRGMGREYARVTARGCAMGRWGSEVMPWAAEAW